jgi:uncharacterized membrane protein
MHLGSLDYLPLSPFSFSILVGIFFLLLVMIQVGVLRYAYMRLGVSSSAAIALLFAALIGSYFNIPVDELAGRQAVAGREFSFFGMQYVAPAVIDWPGTIVAVNVGGAVIPALMSSYLLLKNRLWLRSLVAVAGVATVCYFVAQPIPGVGIVEPVFVPALSTAILALLLSRRRAAPLAYIAGSLGTLIGADLLNLDNIQSLGAPVVSIGGAGTFDGIFLTAILAVLFASLTQLSDNATPGFHSHDGKS